MPCSRLVHPALCLALVCGALARAGHGGGTHWAAPVSGGGLRVRSGACGGLRLRGAGEVEGTAARNTEAAETGRDEAEVSRDVQRAAAGASKEDAAGMELPSILLPPAPNPGLRDLMAQTFREIPLFEPEELLEADRAYDDQMMAAQRARLGHPRRGAENATGPAALQWRLVEGGVTGVGALDRCHLVAMHREHKTALAFFHATLDGACRFMPGREGPAYFLFSDASCAQADYWLPDNITGTPNANHDSDDPPENYLNPFLHRHLLEGHGDLLPRHGREFGSHWRFRELGEHILVTHDRLSLELWLTAQGFVCLGEGGSRFATVVSGGQLQAEWDYSGDHPSWLVSCCLRQTGVAAVAGRALALQQLQQDAEGFEAEGAVNLEENRARLRAYAARRRADNGEAPEADSGSFSTFSSSYGLYNQLLKDGDSSAAVEAYTEHLQRKKARSLARGYRDRYAR